MSDKHIEIIEQFSDWLDGHEIAPPPKPEALHAMWFEMSDKYTSIIEQFSDWLDGHEISPPPRPETMQALRAAVRELRIQQARRESGLEDND